MNSEKRIELHKILVDLLGSGNVYFQPPSAVKMKYPCIVYQLSQVKPTYADDNPYTLRIGYQVILIDADPDTQIPRGIAELPRCKFDGYYAAENLNHYVFNLFY